MARRFTRGRSVIPGPRRQMVWIGSDFSVQTIVALSPLLLTTLNAAALLLRPFTIIRSRMLISYGSDQSGASEANMAIFSEQVVTEVAAAAGVTSIPTPLTEIDADYYTYAPIAFNFNFGTAASFTDVRGSGGYTVVDSKAMRKVDVDDDVVQVVQQQVAVGGLISVVGRTLIKLH